MTDIRGPVIAPNDDVERNQPSNQLRGRKNFPDKANEYSINKQYPAYNQILFR